MPSKKQTYHVYLLILALTVPARMLHAQTTAYAAESPIQEQAAAKPQTTGQTAEEASVLPGTTADGSHKKISLLFTMGPLGILNTESTTKSAPSPIVFTVGAGISVPLGARTTFEPRLAFFSNYYLWDGSNALPAEVENRTALALSMLIDLPAVYTFYRENSMFQAGGGLALLARYGILAGGVSSSDSGASGSAGGDVDKINAWFWSGCRFLYPELLGSWMFTLNRRLKAGAEQRIYVPLGSLINGRGLDGIMAGLNLRIIVQ